MKTTEPTIGRQREFVIVTQLYDEVEQDDPAVVVSQRVGPGESHPPQASVWSSATRRTTALAASGAEHEAPGLDAGPYQLLPALLEVCAHPSADRRDPLNDVMGFGPVDRDDLDPVGEGVVALLDCAQPEPGGGHAGFVSVPTVRVDYEDERRHPAPDGQHRDRHARRLVTSAWVESCRRGHLEQARTLLTAACRLQPCIARSGWAAASRAFILVNEGGDLTAALGLLHDAIALESLDGGDHKARAAPRELASELAVLRGRGEPQADQPLIEGRGTLLPPMADGLPQMGATSGRRGDELWERRESLFDVVHAGRRHGATVATVRAAALLSLDSYLAGRWDHVAQTAAEWIPWCDELGLGSLAWPFHHHRALVAAARGETATVEASSLALIRWASPRGARQLIGYGRHALGHEALAHGDFEEAYRQASGVRFGLGGTAGAAAVHSAMLDLVDAALHTGQDPRPAAQLASSAAAATGSPRLSMLAGGAAAMCAADDAAEEAFEAAVAWPGADRWPFDAARIRLAFGEHLRRHRQPRRSRDHLAAAADAFQLLGARPWLQRATAELRATGITRRHQPAYGSALLTEQERTVALLAAQGLTNKQIGAQLSLSSRTISAHLYRVFPKLGVTSRTALRTAVDLVD